MQHTTDTVRTVTALYTRTLIMLYPARTERSAVKLHYTHTQIHTQSTLTHLENSESVLTCMHMHCIFKTHQMQNSGIQIEDRSGMKVFMKRNELQVASLYVIQYK